MWSFIVFSRVLAGLRRVLRYGCGRGRDVQVIRTARVSSAGEKRLHRDREKRAVRDQQTGSVQSKCLYIWTIVDK